MCLGESTTQNQYPRDLELILNQSGIGMRFNVVDEGKTGVSTLWILDQVESLIDVYHPDLVVAMMGVNDYGRILYYNDIPEASSGIFRHSKAYRFMRLIYMNVVNKLRKEDINGRKNGNLAGRFFETGLIAGDKKYGGSEKDYLELGSVYGQQDKLPEAEDFFKKAIELNPGSDKACSELGWLYRYQGKYSQAEEIFKKAIELNPKNDNAYFGLGILYRDQGNYSQAESMFKKAAALYPENNNACIGLGWLYIDPVNYPRTEYVYKKAVEINKKNEKAYLELGSLYQSQGKYLQAEEMYKKAITLNPKNWKAYLELGWFYHDQGKYPLAEEVFKKAIDLDAKNDKPYGAISILYGETGKPECAKEYAQKANRLRAGFYNSVSAGNYRKFKEILDKRGVRLVCAQYPMRSVEPLKKIFEDYKDVFFVDNDISFKEIVKKSGLKEVFLDMFAGDFGHCTAQGNKLIAENIAHVILKEVLGK
jgi:tetratricopeptide (TPR) repeat protein